MKKVLIIMGSHRKSVNTSLLVEKAEEVLEFENVHTTKINLRDIKINLCKACDYCGRTGKCVIDDDMQKLYKKFNESDGIIIASPLYFNSVSSMTKIMIDRCQMYWGSKFQLKKPSIDINKKRTGMFIGVGGSPYKKNQFDACIPIMDLFFKSIDSSYKYNFFVSDTDKYSIKNRDDILRKLDKKIKEFVKSINE